MAYQLVVDSVDEDTGAVSNWIFNDTVYETYALAQKMAQKACEEYCYDGINVREADKTVYVKQPKPDDCSNDGDSVYYGCPEHVMFGDAWLEVYDNRSFY